MTRWHTVAMTARDQRRFTVLDMIDAGFFAFSALAIVWLALPWLRYFTWWIGSFPLFTPVSVSDAVEPVILYEQTVVLIPADDDAEG